MVVGNVCADRERPVLTDLKKKSEPSLDKTRDAALDLIDRALRNMRPINERTSEIQTV